MAWPRAALAEAPTIESEARQWFERGRALYLTADYASAVVSFQTSYRLAPRAELLFDIAQALRLSGKCVESLAYYERYRAELKEGPPSGFDEALQKAERCAKDEGSRKPAETTQATPEPKDAPLEPAAAPPLPAVPQPKAMAPVERTGWDFSRTLGVSLVVVGGLSAAGAAIGALEALHAADETSTLSRRGGSWDAEAQATEDAGRKWATWSVALTATSVASLGAGLWLLLRPAARSSVGFSAAATPGGASLSWASTF